MVSRYLINIFATITVISGYPIFKQRGLELQLPPDFALWPHIDTAPMYGYPDYGDYGDPRPAYSELDIVREQLAHPQQALPFTKRFPSSFPNTFGEPFPLEYEEEANLLDNEVPLQVNKPAIETLTEALMEALIRQSESDTNLLETEDIDSDDNDDVVQELKETAEKKSLNARPTVKTTVGVKIHVEDKHPEEGGQKEIPLLRPPTHPVESSPEKTESKENKVMTGSNKQQEKKSIGRYAKRRQKIPYVSTGDDLTKELSGLKKIVQ